MSYIEVEFVVSSGNPLELAQFYSFLCNGKILKGENKSHFLVLSSSGMRINLYRPSSRSDLINKGRGAAICLQKKIKSDRLTALREWIAEIISKGGEVLEERLEDFGAEAWMKDPEGNDFLIVVVPLDDDL